ncbi:MAG: RusA family crossover junction endodeoxyribonuclease [Phascolarctobacterium sp.]|nr:RusA family crossover junction endodeoxyribonuclease [Phascolarctobacterium sp.]
MQIKLTLPIPPSVNACYANRKTNGMRGRILTDEGRNWKNLAGWEARAAAQKVGWQLTTEKVIIELIAHWPDARKHDMNNTHKLLADAFEGILYENDNVVLMRDMDFDIDRKRPRLEVTIRPKGAGT